MRLTKRSIEAGVISGMDMSEVAVYPVFQTGACIRLLSGRSMKYCMRSKCLPVDWSYLIMRNPGLWAFPVTPKDGILNLQGVTDGAMNKPSTGLSKTYKTSTVL